MIRVGSTSTAVRPSIRDLVAQLAPMPVSSTGFAGAACEDCGAGVGAACNDDCPTRMALDAQLVHDEFENVPEPCCPSPQYAAAVLCGCGGYGSAVAS